MKKNYSESEQIKKELAKRIVQLLKLAQELENVEKDTGLGFDELIESNDEYRDLSDKCSELHEEISSLLIDSKYFILTGAQTLAGIQLFDLLEFLDNKPERYNTERAVERRLDLKMLEMREGLKRRLKQVSRIYLPEHINPAVQSFYKEIICCFVYGNFNSCCILCRAIIESMATKFIEHQGHGDLLSKDNVKAKKMSIQDILLNVLGTNKDIVVLYTKIERKANEILHKQYGVTEEIAYNTVALLQEFIKKFPAQK